MRRAKIVATLGPASSSYDQIRAIIEAGVDVARMNLSHGSHDIHEQIYRDVRKAASDLDKPVGVFVDLQGPKIRLTKFKDGPVLLEKGATFKITTDEIEGDVNICGTTFKGLPADVAAQVQRQAAGRALSGGFAGSQAARNLTARDLGRTSLALQQAGGQQFANILGTTPLAPVANYEFTPQDITRLRESERISRMNALAGVASMPSAGGVVGQGLGSLGSGLTNLGFAQLGAETRAAGGTGLPTGYGREGLL
jgi:hypothetical protein